MHLARALDLELPLLEIGFLVPDPADRPAVLRAYRALMKAMPPEARRRAASGRLAAEMAAGTVQTVPRSDTIAIIAARYEKRDAYLVAARARCQRRWHGLPRSPKRPFTWTRAARRSCPRPEQPWR